MSYTVRDTNQPGPEGDRSPSCARPLSPPAYVAERPRFSTYLLISAVSSGWAASTMISSPGLSLTRRTRYQIVGVTTRGVLEACLR